MVGRPGEWQEIVSGGQHTASQGVCMTLSGVSHSLEDVWQLSAPVCYLECVTGTWVPSRFSLLPVCLGQDPIQSLSELVEATIRPVP